MKDNEVLAQVRDHLRAERADDAGLVAVARGEAGSEVVIELERRAASDPELAAAIASSRPLGAEAEARIWARIEAERVALRAKVARAGARDAAGSAPVASKPREGRVVALARRAAVIAGPLALAAAVTLYVAGRGGGGEGAVLPEYALTAGGDQAMRGSESPSVSATQLRLQAGPEATFELLVRPATAAPARVAAYCFAIGEGEPNPVEATIEVAAEGSVRIRGPARALAGAREVRVVLGTANDSIKRFDDALARARDGNSDARVRVLKVAIVRP
jgi:hypothetical protein